MDNNIFKYATSELSQDAVICWCINWINYPDRELYPLGTAALNLFLGDNNFKEYNNVEVKRQQKNMDVVVYFTSKGEKYALIIEDKVHTTEHDNQISRYKDNLQKDYGEVNKIFVAYIKIGVIYDKDWMIGKRSEAITLVDLEKWVNTLEEFKQANKSDNDLNILQSYLAYLSNMLNERNNIEKAMGKQPYEQIFNDQYGQFHFLDKVFNDRGKGQEKIVNTNIPKDWIYDEWTRSGRPCTQYCFWEETYPTGSDEKNMYHYMFWRIDTQSKLDSCITLRHYDANARSKTNEEYNERKRIVYRKLRAYADKITKEKFSSDKYKEIFAEVGIRENYKESDLLFIPAQNLQKIGNFEEVRIFLREITKKMREFAEKTDLLGREQ